MWSWSLSGKIKQTDNRWRSTVGGHFGACSLFLWEQKLEVLFIDFEQRWFVAFKSIRDLYMALWFLLLDDSMRPRGVQVNSLASKHKYKITKNTNTKPKFREIWRSEQNRWWRACKKSPNEFRSWQAPTKVPTDDLPPDPSNINVWKHKHKQQQIDKYSYTHKRRYKFFYLYSPSA